MSLCWPDARCSGPTGHAENSEIPLAVVERYSADNYRIRTISDTWFDPHSAVNMLRISEKPVPFPDAERGCWIIDLVPYRGVGSETASLYVEYISHTIYCTFDSCYSVEVGPMGHYEDYPFILKEQHDESEFSGWDQLIKCLVDFVPHRNASRLESVPNAHHVNIDDVQLYELISNCVKEKINSGTANSGST